MRILHVITDFSAKGGAEAMLSKLILSMPGHEHHIVSLMQLSAMYEETLGACRSATKLQWSLKKTPMTVYRLIRLMAEIQPDVVQCWMYHANVLGAVAHRIGNFRMKLFWGIRHSLNDYESESRSVKVALRMSRLLRRVPNGVVYCALEAVAQHRRIGIDHAPDFYIPNGVEFGKFSRRPKFIESGSKSKSVVVGAAGRFHPAKGYPYLLRAIAEIKAKGVPVDFVLAGRGVSADNKDFVALMENSGLNSGDIRLLGDVTDMVDFYSGIDLFVLSSITEGFPNVLIESMACGVPCVATDVGDVRDIVGEYGIVVPSKDPGALADAILKFLNMPLVERDFYGRGAGASVASRFSMPAVADQYDRLWSGRGIACPSGSSAHALSGA